MKTLLGILGEYIFFVKLRIILLNSTVKVCYLLV